MQRMFITENVYDVDIRWQYEALFFIINCSPVRALVHLSRGRLVSINPLIIIIIIIIIT